MSAMQAIHAAKHGEVATQLLVMAPLVYMCMCCHYALMRMGVLKFKWVMRMGIGFVYHMVPRCTHSQSLLRNGGWVCRFIAPICYNFLHVIRMHLYLSAGEVGFSHPCCTSSGSRCTQRWARCRHLLLQIWLYRASPSPAMSALPAITHYL